MRVLVTRGFSYVVDLFELVDRRSTGADFDVYLSGRPALADLGVPPSRLLMEGDLSSDEYVDWLIAAARGVEAGLLWPQGRLGTVIEGLDRLTAAGLKVLLPTRSSATLEAVHDKSRCMELLATSGVPLPRAIVCAERHELIDGVARLEALGVRPCVKPVRGVYGHGFRVIDPRPFADRFLSNDSYFVSKQELLSAADELLARSPFLVMEYLEGVERSLDCLVDQGELLLAVTRRKEAGSKTRILEHNEEAVAIARAVCARFQLHGLVNVQTRERSLPGGGVEQCFLEVNARPSGGIAMSCASGVNLPLLALELEVGRREPTSVPSSFEMRRVSSRERVVITCDV